MIPLLLFFFSLYTFDMRFLDKPLMVHMDHVSAVLDVDYSPTGKEFVSASFDKSIRIFPVDKGHSRSVILQISFSWDPSSTSSLNTPMNSFSIYDTRFLLWYSEKGAEGTDCCLHSFYTGGY